MRATLLLVALAAFPAAAAAATFTVDSPADAVDANPGDGLCATAVATCTLRAAVQEANALPGPDAVEVPAGVYPLTLVGAGEDLAATGDLDVTDDLVLEGSGAAATVIDGSNLTRLLEVRGAAVVTVQDVTLRRGRATSGAELEGGAVRSTGTLALDRVVVEDGFAAGTGGGVASRGGSAALTVRDSTFVRNTVVAGGGSAVAAHGGTAAIVGCTFEANFASGSLGGGTVEVFDGATAAVRNSTLSDNIGHGLANLEIAPLFADGTLVVSNVTVAGSASLFARIAGTDPAASSVGNTILAGRSCAGVFTSTGYNLLQDPTGCTIAGDPTGNLLGVDPVLGPLAANGGPTRTHALATGSPAVDAGNPAAPGSGGAACEATDQRTVLRPVGARCEMGAWEGTAVLCGNHVVDAGEGCDVGRGSASDCCDPQCLLLPGGTTCRAALGGCDVAETCDGASAACPANVLVSAGTVCRPAANTCDAAEVCNGSVPFCPLDALLPDGAPCGDICITGATCTAGMCGGGTLDPASCVDSYLCYAVRDTARFAGMSVGLADEFESGPAVVERPRALCLPAATDGGTTLDPGTHEEAYRVVPAGAHVPRVGVQVTDRFGTLSLDTVRASRLLVPTHVGLGIAPAGPPPPGAADHYECYRARITRGTPRLARGLRVAAADQFEDRRYRVRGPRWLCNPVDKNGEGLVRPVAHLVCYGVKRARGEPAHTPVVGQIQTLNQLGPGRLDTIREEALCVPALKTP